MWQNLIANFLGKSWSAVTALLFVPIYIRFLGIEAYGLIGFFTLLTMLMAPMDTAISFTLNRDLARLSAKETSPQQFKDLLRTLEIPFWTCSFCLGLGIVFAASYLAQHWVNLQLLSVKSVASSISLMGIALVLQWPISLYSSGLQGLQRQVILNVILICMSSLRSFGAVAAMYWIEPSIFIFFLWQVIASLVHAVTIAVVLWRNLPQTECRPQFNWKYLREASPFAIRMGVLSLVTLVFVNADKIILSKLAPLEDYGYYTLSSTLAAGLYFIITPVFSVFFPKYCQIVASGNQEEIASLYYKSSRFLAALLVPAACVLVYFSNEILFLWTKNGETVEKTSSIFSILALGTAFNGLMNMPYALQLAYGWTRLVLIQNLVSFVLLLPVTIVCYHYYGLIGASFSWLVHNMACVMICLPIIHYKFLKHWIKQWFWECFTIPGGIAFLVTYLGYRFVHVTRNGFGLLLLIALTYILGVALTSLITLISPKRLARTLLNRIGYRL